MLGPGSEGWRGGALGAHPRVSPSPAHWLVVERALRYSSWHHAIGVGTVTIPPLYRRAIDAPPAPLLLINPHLSGSRQGRVPLPPGHYFLPLFLFFFLNF
jgi:hypothetical protein